MSSVNNPTFREWEYTEVGLIHWLCPGMFFFSFCGGGDYFIAVKYALHETCLFKHSKGTIQWH